MREIIFRGKCNDLKCTFDTKKCDKCDGNKYGWLFGDLCTDSKDGKVWVNYRTVTPETVGQFTGLLDKNGVKIFEGDIVKYKRQDIAKVVFGDGSFYGVDKHSISDNIYVKELVEVIGNIHDNPELVAAGENSKEYDGGARCK